MNGKGKLVENGVEIYIGSFKDDLFHGNGIHVY